MTELESFDLIIIGAGPAGMAGAISAAERGARVLLVEKTNALGGTLPFAREMSAAGTHQQAERGIEDSPQRHFDEVRKLAKGYENTDLLRLAVEHAADTIAWLENLGVTIDPDTPKIVYNHEAYDVPRTYFANGGGREVVDVLTARLMNHFEAGAVTLKLETSFTGFLTQSDRVTGIEMQTASGETAKAHGANILLACGGYGANQNLHQDFHGVPQIMAWAPEHAQGDGLVAAKDIGADIVGADGFNLSFGGVMEGDGPSRKIICRLNTLPQMRQPWEIIVNSEGQRFIREDEPSIDRQEAALMEQHLYRGFMVFDEHMRRNAPDRIRKWYIEPGQEDFEALDWFYKADTIEALCEAAGIDAAGMQQTIETYNAYQASGSDPLGRQHMPHPIGEGPYYAIRFEGCNVISAAGIRADKDLRTLRPDGSAIEGLYVAGECLGHCQLMGKSAAGGMMATPALTFGRLLGETLAIKSSPQPIFATT